jgi:hypothetical protein
VEEEEKASWLQASGSKSKSKISKVGSFWGKQPLPLVEVSTSRREPSDANHRDVMGDVSLGGQIDYYR